MLGENRLRLIEKTFTREEFYGNLRKYAKIKHVDWNPDITISRDPGSGGRLVAKKVAKKLGWEYYDKRILKKIAKELGYEERIVEAVDEHPRSRLVDIFFAAFNPNYISEFDYLNALKKLIIEVGKEKDVVFLGRGSNHIIPASKALRVRITAPFETRVKNTIKYEGKSRQAAIDWVKKVENKRNDFIKQYFNCDPDCPDYFDLVINTENIALTQARDIVITALKRKFPYHKF